MSKVQFKLNVDPRIRDITAMHALQTGTDMSITIAKVVEEVLLPELTPASLAEVKAKEKMRADEAREASANR